MKAAGEACGGCGASGVPLFHEHDSRTSGEKLRCRHCAQMHTSVDIPPASREFRGLPIGGAFGNPTR